MMSHIDLCSGVGGFALGFEWAGLSKPVLFCDIEPWSRKILAKHWPQVPIVEDVKELSNDTNGLIPDTDPRNTILTAGYPCQPFSGAGKRLGTQDPRHIYPYISRIIAQKRPAWVVLENVYGHLSLGLDEVLNDLESKEYSTRTFILPSGAIVGAPHRRQRIWIVAHANSQGEPISTIDEQWMVGNSQHDGLSSSQVGGEYEENGRGASQGQKQTDKFEGASKRKSNGTMAYTGCNGLQGRTQTRNHEKNWAQPNDEQFERRSGTREPDRQRPAFWKPEPTVGRVAHGVPRRVDRIRGLGNAIVPQIAQKIGEVIKAQHDRN